MSVPGEPQRPLLRPMDLGDILDGTFRVFRRAWLGLLLIGLIGAVPSLLAGLFSFSALRLGPLQDIMAGKSSVTPFLPRSVAVSAVSSGFTGLIGLLFFPLVRGTIVALCTAVVLGQAPDFRAAVRTGLRRYLPLLGTYLLLVPLGVLAAVPIVLVALRHPSPGTILAVVLPTVLLGVPAALVLAVYFVFLNQVVVSEGVAGLGAFRRSMGLVHRRFWPLLGLGVIVTIMVTVAAFVFAMLVDAPLAVVGMVRRSAGTLGLTQVVGVLPNIVTIPFVVAAQTLAYFETRARKEGLDLELLAEAPPPAQP